MNRDLLSMPEDLFHVGIKALIRNEEGKILLFETNIKGSVLQPHWDFPGGRIHQNERISETLKREIEEETGLKDFSIGDLLYSGISNFRIPYDQRDIGLVLFVYDCKINDKDKITLSNEHFSFDWFAPKEAAELLKIKYSFELTQIIAKL